jgi:deoxycytidine triphosphate deaminase
MSILSRQSIKARCRNPDSRMVYRRDNKPLKIEPVSIDLHLAEIELDNVICKTGSITLYPNVFCLGSVMETFNMPDDLAGYIIGKSTNAREGLQIEAAGLVDPGFVGDITLELKNLHHRESVRLEIGELIGQAYFLRLDEPVDVPYGPGNHYQGQQGVTRSHRK